MKNENRFKLKFKKIIFFYLQHSNKPSQTLDSFNPSFEYAKCMGGASFNFQTFLYHKMQNVTLYA